ncbi:MAG TPA: efflux transporter outer membrane subunit [Sediminibacterium sp.]|nr:efflux transporter outer membrane subunit [Sediminibacterium sp.]
MKPIIKYILILIAIVWSQACKVPALSVKQENKVVPVGYSNMQDTMNMVSIPWRNFFSDPHLIALIDTALQNNQELNIMLQEIEMSKNEVFQRQGEYKPSVNIRAGIAADRSAKYTWDGFSEEAYKTSPDKGRQYIGDFMVGTYFSWELDVWKKLRNATKSAAIKYSAAVEGRNFIVTHIIAEIADSYYELMALDNQLDIVQQNIDLQSNVLKVIKQQKEAAKVTQLAVNRFEAQLLNTKNLRYQINQQITETENRIRYLTGKYTPKIERNSVLFNTISIGELQTGIPSQLLMNRPDIRQAELNIAAAKLDVQVAKANFYPSFSIKAGLGFRAFNPLYLVQPASILYNLAGDMVAPLINKNAIIATYYNANAQQIQAVYSYEQTILTAYTEVLNQIAKAANFKASFEMKSKEVDILLQSVSISNNLFNSARADYMEVLLTQREALESKMQLIEIRMKQLNAKVNIYRALGGGWG